MIDPSRMDGSTATCIDPALQRYLADYCFGEITEYQKARFEAHLLDCDTCWVEVQRLSDAVRTLRTDKALLSGLSPADLFEVVAESSRLQLPFGGHHIHAVFSSMLYGLNYSVLLLLEVAYGWDRFGSAALALSPIVMAFIWLSNLGLMIVAWRSADSSVTDLRKRLSSATTSLGVIIAALLLYLALSLFLPPYPMLRDGHWYSAQSAYLKDIVYLVPVAIVFLLLPYHLILALQRELRDGHYRLVSSLLAGDKLAVAPKRVVSPRLSTLRIVALMMVGISILQTTNLLDRLPNSPYTNLFTILIFIRLAVYFGLVGWCLFWYSGALNELKRECLAVQHDPSLLRFPE